MCKTCREIYHKIALAQRQQDAEKARVLTVILKGHQANTCKGKK